MSTLGLLVFRAPIARGLGRLAPRGRLGKKAMAPRGRVPLHHLRGDRLYPAAAGGGVRYPAPGRASGQPCPHLSQQFAAVLRVPLRSALLLPVRRWPRPSCSPPGGWPGSCCGRPGSSQLPFATLSLGQTPGCWRWGSSCCSCFWPPCPAGAPPHQIRRPGHGGVLLAVSGLEHLRWQDVLTVAVADAGDASCVVLMKNGKGAVLSLGGYNSSSALQLFRGTTWPGWTRCSSPPRTGRPAWPPWSCWGSSPPGGCCCPLVPTRGRT